MQVGQLKKSKPESDMVEIKYEEHGTTIVMTIAGEFYIESVQYAESIWFEIIEKKPSIIGINCRQVKFIDSSAIGVLVKFLNNAMKLKIELVFFDLSDTVFSVFKTAKLGNFFKIMTKVQFDHDYLT